MDPAPGSHCTVGASAVWATAPGQHPLDTGPPQRHNGITSPRGTRRCVEMLIKEQMRKYKVKMEEISQLEAAESIACRRLSLLQQNAVSRGRP